MKFAYFFVLLFQLVCSVYQNDFKDCIPQDSVLLLLKNFAFNFVSPKTYDDFCLFTSSDNLIFRSKITHM